VGAYRYLHTELSFGTRGLGACRLNQAEVPCSPIYSIADIFKDPQYVARETLIAVENATAGKMKMPAVIPRLSDTPGEVRWLGRALGEDTDAILGDMLAMSHEQQVASVSGA
jgi:crotonobetainyl-CoA:carnitine CoA-transferase CaiB-like acyl-CoA transferase